MASKATKGMKASKAMKTMKAMKDQSPRTDGGILRDLVWRGEIGFTRSGLEKTDLIMSKGKLISRKAHEKGKTNRWVAACTAARKALAIKGFVAVKKGSPLYKKAHELYKK